MRLSKKQSGLLLTETLVGVSILAMVMAGVAVTTADFGQLNDFQMARQRCLAAAQAQLDGLAAGHGELSAADVARLWPGVTTAVTRQPGQGDWAGLTQVTVTAELDSRGRAVRVSLARCIPAATGGN